MVRSRRKRRYAPSLADRSASRSSIRKSFMCAIQPAFGLPLAVTGCDDHGMMKFVLKTLLNAAAIGVAAWLIKGIDLTGPDWQQKGLTLVLVALVFGVVNFFVKPLVKLFSL